LVAKVSALSEGQAPVEKVHVRVLLFAAYRDRLGASELDLELPVGSSVTFLIAYLREQRGAEALPGSPAVAVNQEYAPLNTVLEEGDEVAFIPPVAGG
jgi:molybdopterin converting factor subunit 1